MAVKLNRPNINCVPVRAKVGGGGVGGEGRRKKPCRNEEQLKTLDQFKTEKWSNLLVL